MQKRKVIIGSTEFINLPRQGLKNIPAKVDTGALSTSIASSDIREVDGVLHFKLFAPGMPWYTAQDLTTQDFTKVTIESSFGHQEKRYRIYLMLELAGRRIKARVTLSNRTEKAYPILLGRRLLNNKFVVDVSDGMTSKLTIQKES